MSEHSPSPHRYAYPLSVQLTLPEGFREDQRFLRVLGLLRRWGFSSVELNIPRFEAIRSEELAQLLQEYGLSMSYFATGATAKAEGLSLSADEDARREQAVRRCLDMVEFAANFPPGAGTGIIVGFLKGPAGPDREGARRRLSASLASIMPRAERRCVPLLIEATNRYEAAAVNTLEEAASLVAPLASEYARILPDTFHMNIEERDPAGALAASAPYYNSVHLSDNNRLLPGLGAIDFSRVLGWLERAGHRGGLALEGNIRGDMVEDIEASMRYLAPLLHS
jgi:sugar phosphate isomerase/epimerase